MSLVLLRVYLCTLVWNLRKLPSFRSKPAHFLLPWVPEVFLACGGNFRCWPKTDTSSAVGRSHDWRSGHYRDLTETGNRARKVSGTQGNFRCTIEGNRSFCSAFSSHLASIKCNILRSINHKAKQARFKCNITPSLSHKPITSKLQLCS